MHGALDWKEDSHRHPGDGMTLSDLAEALLVALRNCATWEARKSAIMTVLKAAQVTLPAEPYK